MPEGGLVLAEKVSKPLQAILDAYQARLRSNQTNEERLRAYPDPEIEKERLDIFQKMIQVTQSPLDRQNMGINQTTQEPWNEAVKETKSKRGSKRHSKHKTWTKPSATPELKKEFPAKEMQKDRRNEIK